MCSGWVRDRNIFPSFLLALCCDWIRDIFSPIDACDSFKMGDRILLRSNHARFNEIYFSLPAIKPNLNFWIEFLNICHFWWKVPFFVYFGHFLDNFRALFLFDQYQRVPDYWIELSFELNQQNFFFKLNNILNWILGKAILNRILNGPFFGKIQTLNGIR